MALDLHLRGSVRQKVDLVTYHIVVASLHLRESVRSNRATLIGYWAGRQQAVKKTGSIQQIHVNEGRFFFGSFRATTRLSSSRATLLSSSYPWVRASLWLYGRALNRDFGGCPSVCGVKSGDNIVEAYST